MGKLSQTHSRQRDAYQRRGVGMSEDEAHVRDSKVVRMGAEVDGFRGSVGAPILKKFEAAFFGLWCIGLRLLLVLGRLVHAANLEDLLCACCIVCGQGAPLILRKLLTSSSMHELLLAI